MQLWSGQLNGQWDVQERGLSKDRNGRHRHRDSVSHLGWQEVPRKSADVIG